MIQCCPQSLINHNYDRVCLKIWSEPVSGYDKDEDELLQFNVPWLSIVQDWAFEFSLVLELGWNSRQLVILPSINKVLHCYWFTEDWRRSQIIFELFKSIITFWGP